jgi:hypothetical protein
MRAAALAVATAVLLLQPLGTAAASPRELPPKLDVDAALEALRTQPIYRAPGAMAYLDTDRIRRELTPRIRVLVAPFTGRIEKGGNYATDDQHLTEVYEPLIDWSERTGITLIRIEGLLASSSEGVSATPSDLAELRQHTGQYDITEAVLSLIRHAKDVDPDAPPTYPSAGVVPPTPQQLDELTARLRDRRVYNAPDRVDRVELPLRLIQQRTGFRVRVAALGIAHPGEPIVRYAPSLARRFPGEVVMVAHGAWLEVAGPNARALSSARNYAYGRYETGSFRQGIVMRDRVATVLVRAHELVAEHPFGRPQPPTLRGLLGDLAPWLVGGSALLLGEQRQARR